MRSGTGDGGDADAGPGKAREANDFRAAGVGAAGGDRLKRLRLRSWRRGMREMDLILGPFADAGLAGWTRRRWRRSNNSCRGTIKNYINGSADSVVFRKSTGRSSARIRASSPDRLTGTRGSSSVNELYKNLREVSAASDDAERHDEYARQGCQGPAAR